MATFELQRLVNETVGPCGVGRIGPRGSSFLFPVAGREDVDEAARVPGRAIGPGEVTGFEFRRRVNGTARPCGVGRIGPRGSSFLIPVTGREDVDEEARVPGRAIGPDEVTGFEFRRSVDGTVELLSQFIYLSRSLSLSLLSVVSC